MNDLSQHHRPISDFCSGVDDRTLADFRLTDQQLDQFQNEGYVAGIPILDSSQVERLRGELAELMRPSAANNPLFHEYHSNESTAPDTVLMHALGAWRIMHGFHDLLWHPAVTVPASQLFDGASVRFWHDQLFCKPPQHGGVVAWHQDYSYWTRTQPIAHLTCWIALDDADEQNGCLQYVPGSQCWDLLPITGLAGDMNAIRDVLSNEQWDALQRPISVCLKAGEATYHHPLLVHGSHLNRSDRPRRATVVNVFRDGTTSASDESLLRGVPPIPKGNRIEGQFFPLLLDTSHRADK